MKTLICGKGGSGKSTVAALLAREATHRGDEVLVMDTDESNSGLSDKLGMEKPEDFMYYFGGKDVLHEKMKKLQNNWKIEDIPSKYLARKNGISLISMGKIYDFGEGCACPINELSSRFLEKLEIGENERLIADTDAGIEHLGRGVDEGCDNLLVVVEPSRESIDLSKKIARMTKEVGKEAYYVLNKVDKKKEEILKKSLDESRILASLPVDERISSYSLNGKSFDFRMNEIEIILDLLERKNG